MLRESPDYLFVFGDNILGKGFGGQAKEMRGEPNAIGIPTKWEPNNKSQAFFQDSDIVTVGVKIDYAFQALYDKVMEGGTVVIPKKGIGTGLANLKNTSPIIYNYIQECFSILNYLNEEVNNEDS